MGRITQITVDRHILLQTGDFENAKFGASFVMVLDEDDDPDTEYEALVDQCMDKLQNDAVSFLDDS